MKIWRSFSGEHSAKLRIVGRFKTTDDAKKAEDLFNGLLEVEPRFPRETERFYSKELLNFITENNFSIPPEDIEYLDYLYPVKAEGNTIQVDTDDWALHPLMQAMVRFGAKIEVYSKHDYPA